MATQKTIAQALGISQPAVGAVLGKHSGSSKISVSPEMRELILAKAKELGYRPNVFAQALSGVSTKTIGCIHFDTLLPCTVQQKILIASAIRRAGYRIATVNGTPVNLVEPNSFNDLIDQVIDMRVDGVVLSFIPGLMKKEHVARLTERGIPCVSLRGVPFPSVPFFGVDSIHGFSLLTRHLLRQGYRRPLLILLGDEEEPWLPLNLTDEARIQGFEAAITEGGGHLIALKPSDHAANRIGEKTHVKNDLLGYTIALPTAHRQPYKNPYVTSHITTSSHEEGFQIFNHVLDMGYDFDVILMPNDNFLQGALTAAKRRNISVPRDIGLTGFDGAPFGQYGLVPFTTLGLPTEIIVDKGIKLLKQAIEKPEAASLQGKVTPASKAQALVSFTPCSLIPGETTCPQT